MTLRAPPKSQSTRNIVGRFVGLIILLLAFALFVWSMVINQQIPLVETVDPHLDPPGEHIAVERRDVHVRRIGAGDRTIVVLHDDTIAGGATVVPVAEALAGGEVSVLIPDLVGFGFSSRPATSGRHYSVAGQTELLAALLDELGIGSSQVIGLGWGGSVAAELAVTRPDLVAELVMIDPTLTGDDRNEWAGVEGLPLGVGRAVSYTIEGATATAEERFLEGCERGSWCDNEEVLDGFRRAIKVPGTATSIQARRATPSASVALARLDTISIPVTLAWSGDAPSGEDAELRERFEATEVEQVDGLEPRPALSVPQAIADLIG